MLVNVCKRYEKATFDNFEGEKELVNLLRKPHELKDNVIITGGVGTGKTHLAYALLNQEAEIKEYNGKNYYSSNFVQYTTIKKIIDIIRMSWKYEGTAENIEEYYNIPLLIIDEIGIQYGSESERIELFDLFNERYNNMLPTIVISNYSRREIESKLGLRISDRLYGNAHVFEIKQKSKR